MDLTAHDGDEEERQETCVGDVAVLVDALERIAERECVLDPTIVSRLVTRPREQSPLNELTKREREVLALMAEGHSNDGICTKLFLRPKTVETHVRHILLKLGIGDTAITTGAFSLCSPTCAADSAGALHLHRCSRRHAACNPCPSGSARARSTARRSRPP